METPSTEKLTTRAVGIKYGAFSALAGIILFLISVMINPNPMGGGWTNWLGSAISIVLLVLAHKNFKDSGDGFMSYGQGFGIGFWFTIVSSVLSILVMYVYMNFVDTAAMDAVFEQQALTMEEQGQSDDAIAMAQEWTKKLFWPLAIGGSLFIGIIIALIVSIFTQKNNPNPAF